MMHSKLNKLLIGQTKQFHSCLILSVYNNLPFICQKSIQESLNKKIAMNKSYISTASRSMTLNATSKSHQIESVMLEEKLSEAKQLNQKLQKLFHSLKSNTHMKTLSHSNSSSIISNKQRFEQKKQLQKAQMQVQHMKYLQNLLLCQSKKLKEEVNNRRKERVIYSNIFKKYQKDIRKWEDQYKEALLNSMATTDAQNLMKDKIIKIKRRLEKEIKELEKMKTEKEAEKKMSQLGQTQDIVNQKGKQPTLVSNKSNHMISSSKKNCYGQSYKRLVSQKHLQLKAKNLQSQFQKESRKIMYESLAQQLLHITDTQNLHDAIDLFQTIDLKTQQIYKQYEQLQKQNKEKQSKIHELQMMIKEKETISGRGFDTSKSIQDLEEGKMHEVEELVCEEEKRMKILEGELSRRLDINCRKLKTEQLVPFIERRMMAKQLQENSDYQSSKENTEKKIQDKSSSLLHKNEKINHQGNVLHVIGQNQRLPRKSRNQLDKKLQKIQKQKQVDGYLLSYNQISKSMLKHYVHSSGNK